MDGWDILWKVHAFLMSAAVISAVSAIPVKRFFKPAASAFRLHRRLGLAAFAAAAAGLTASVTAVQLHGSHLTSSHTRLGSAAGLLLLLTPVAGLIIIKGKKADLRTVHKTAGYTAAAAAAAAIVSGLLYMGII